MRKTLCALFIVLCAAPAAYAAEAPAAKFACVLHFNGKTTEAPAVYVKYNKTSHALTLQRQGFQEYYAEQLSKNLWQETAIEEGMAPEQFTFPEAGKMNIIQAGMVLQTCILVE